MPYLVVNTEYQPDHVKLRVSRAPFTIESRDIALRLCHRGPLVPCPLPKSALTDLNGMNGEHTRRQSGITAMDHIPQIDPRLADIGQKVESSYPRNPTASSGPLSNIVNQADLTPSSTLPPLYHSAGYDASQQPNYSPDDTPQLRDFGVNNNEDGASDPNQYMAQAGGTPEEGINDLKRPRACEACRGLKVKCEFDPNNQEGPCRRCTKARRNCVVTQPSRKRQKKTDSRVAELEKKIDALTAVLHATRSDTIPHNVTDTPESLDRRPSNPYEQVTNGGYVPQFGTRPEVRHPASSWHSIANSS